MTSTKISPQRATCLLPPCSCGGRFVARKGKFGEFHGCSNYPTCEIIASWSKWATRWIISDKATRQRRIQAHAFFDAVWRSKKMGRQEAYRWLASELDLPSHECHIQHFDAKTCDRVIALVARRFPFQIDASTETPK